jgi:predicted RNA-binding Zn ribbon-like protein
MAIHRDFAFVGRLCLDFAQTGDMGWGARYERLTSPSELGRWLALSPLELANVRVTATDLEDAKALRGAIWRIAAAVLDEASPSASDVRRVNAQVRVPGLVRALAGDAKSAEWYRPTIAAALATIAQDAVTLFGDAQQRSRLRRCENAECRVVFYDDSRPGSRRWCFPNRCGDRIRAREYRAQKALGKRATNRR